MARDAHIALLFPGQGSQTADMRETVERSRPDLLELALEEVGPDLFERATEPEQRLLRGLLTGELRQGALEGVMLEETAISSFLFRSGRNF